MPAAFVPSSALGYTPLQLQLIQTGEYIRMKWRVTLSEMGTDLSQLTVALPASIKGISALMVGPDSDVDRFWALDARELQNPLPSILRDQDGVPPPRASGGVPNIISTLFSTTAPYVVPLSIRDKFVPNVNNPKGLTTKLQLSIAPARAFTNAFFTAPNPFATYRSGLMLDVIALLSGSPKLQPLRAPRTLAFSAGGGTGPIPTSPLFKLAAVPVCGRRRKTVVLTNPSGAPLNYEIDGVVFASSTITTSPEIIAPLSSGSIVAGASVSIDLSQHMVDAFQILMDLDGVTGGIGGMVIVED